MVVNKYPKSNFYQKSLYNSVTSLEKSLPSATVLEKRVGDRLEPLPMSANILKFIEQKNIISTKAYLL